jgi:hypothetical protein
MQTLVKVSSSVWDNVSDDDKRRITDIISSARLLNGTIEIVGDPGLAVPRWFGCGVACDAGAAAAVAACTAITDGVGYAACMAAASAAAAACHANC